MRAFFVSLVLASMLGACEAAPPSDTLVFVAPTEEALARAFVEELPAELGAAVRVDLDPVAAMAASTEGERRIALVVDGAACDGCYRLEASTGGSLARGSAPLGVQYGLAHWLEAQGVRFFHPSRTYVPTALSAVDASIYGVDHAPQIAERGLQLHILHPIESYFDFWEPGEENLADAERTLHWVVCNRGNFLNLTALENIEDEDERTPWREHMTAILDVAHLRGVRMGLGMQIFGRSSLQRALVLVPDDEMEIAPQIRERLSFFEDLPFDAFNLAFGEFFGAEPDQFIHAVETAYDVVTERWPDAEVSATVHVGEFPDTRITYMGEEMLYYFLIQYVDRPIVPWLHTVMYYNLFEPAGGAYNHTDFSEHREYLLAELAAGRPAGYKPETAYWIAFDNTLPMYLPLYIRSRWLDLSGLRDASPTPISSHVVFSSGWEWGYWQSDVAVMRTSYELPASTGAILEEMFASHPDGGEMARVASELAEIQHEGLMENELAAYLSSTDLTFAPGIAMGFWTQPRRPDFSEMIAMDDAALSAFESDVLSPLTAFRDALRGLEASMAFDTASPFAAELRDGVQIDVARAEFAVAIWSAAVAAGRGMPIDALLTEAETAEAAAETIVRRRHAALLDTDGATLISDRVPTAGLYDYGYLREADTLCFYARELAQLRNAVEGTSRPVPGCVL